MKEGAPKEQVYRAYTKKFDRIIVASDLDLVLGPLERRDRKKVDEAWNAVQAGLLPWKSRLHIASAEFSTRIRSCISDEQRDDTVVSLLLDQSGSMRGQKMLYTAATADIAQEFLGSLGIACEILGFTTAKWKGGNSRKRWSWRLRPPNPGRLNDLLHVVYRDASDAGVSTGGWAYREMLRPDFPKENIDGEAIEWAASRLRSLERRRRLLLVLSDGAPVDESTLRENGPNYLGDHLRAVIDELEGSDDIELAALGIGFAVNRFYSVSRMVGDPPDLGVTLLRFITDLLCSHSLDAKS